MRSSDTPETDPLLMGPQGPADWERETPSDDRLAAEVWRRLLELAETYTSR